MFVRRCLGTLGALTTLAGTAVAVPPAADAAVTCSSYTSRAVLGGYEQTLTCPGGGFFMVEGLGTTLTDASAQAAAVVQDQATTGLPCTFYNGSTDKLGGFGVTLECSGPGGLTFTNGLGTKLTEAAVEARTLVQVYAATHQQCSDYSTSAVIGGFSVTLECIAPAGIYFVTGTGTKLTDAAAAARALIHTS
ncbi:hypothetical protein [Amycolatopsis sp. PS_44_ISF1]|uniref:hypothetical protein n=1 Tax=Amycolatopsis sp. PS_44_ISF1 TaxID=2974917 RepID=UPI0028DE368E|nr:hypothetical protein [Amycolatopsis sp. PS_44_ISF1]MDT8913023.1 hypothetical protein [Amycolatopsis sp. PS_44_ISF1]